MSKKRIIFVSISLFTILLFAGFYSFAIDGRLTNELSWKLNKKNPYIDAIGHWKDSDADTEVIFDADMIPVNMSRSEWQNIMLKYGMTLHKNPEKCDLFIHDSLKFLKDYDACAFKPIGSYTLTSCSYWYIVAAKFESGVLQKSAGTRMVFMC